MEQNYGHGKNVTNTAPVPNGEIAIRLADGTRQVIRDVSFVGTEGSSAPLISVENTLTGSRLNVTASCPAVDANSHETFVDLYGGDADRLGSNNRIYITAASITSKNINLEPTGWDKNTNLIIVKGVRVLGSITGATNANPIVITSAGHELRHGELVTIDDVEGNTNANGSYYAKVLTVDTFSLYTDANLMTGRAGNGTYTSNTGYWGKRFNSVDAAGD